MSIILPILIGLHVIVCILMILVVLMQRPRSEGLGSAFGGGLTDNVFGSQTTNVLARFTTWMGVAFFSITLLLSILTARANSGKTAVQKKLLESPIPAAAATPGTIDASPTMAPDTQSPSEAKATEENPQTAIESAKEQTPATEPVQPAETSVLAPVPATSSDDVAPTSSP